MRIFVPAMGRVNTKNRDGSEVRFAEIARRWLAQGVELLLLLPRREIGVLESQGVRANWRVHWEPFASESDRLWNVLAIYLWRILTCPFARYPKGVDAIYAPSDFLFDLLPALLCRWRNPHAKLVVCVFLIAPNPFKGYEKVLGKGFKLPTIRGLLYFAAQWLSVALARAAGATLLVLNSLDKDALTAMGARAGKVHVVTMGVDMAFFDGVAPSADTPVYDGLFLGRLHPQKGLFDLVRIWRLVCDARPGSKLGIIGGGSDWWFAKLQQEIAAAGLTDVVDLLGFRQGADKVRLLKAAGCFLMPSHYESFGQVAVEAMASGLPVVAYDLPIYREIFPTGMVKTPFEDIRAFTDVVLGLLGEPARRDVAVAAARQRAAVFDWAAIAAREMEIVNNA
ncbi:MAG: glycosyltransferase family 4 protein [Solidesulfovibrio sp. DCME]|uniref:glycosyltransferase family 4 protein n=1 Tax=Solidesulfovibrio sp. DCME TaxID=3447380 RepID=UPI003D0A3D9E